MSTSAGTRSSSNASKAPRVAGANLAEIQANREVEEARAALHEAQARSREAAASLRPGENPLTNEATVRAFANENAAGQVFSRAYAGAERARLAAQTARQQATTQRSTRAAAPKATPKTPAAAYRAARRAALNEAPTIRAYRNNQLTTIRQPESYSQKAQRLAPAVMSRARVEAGRTAKMVAQLKTANARVSSAEARASRADLRFALSQTAYSEGRAKTIEQAMAAFSRADKANDSAKAALRAAQSARDTIQARISAQQRRAGQYERFNFPSIRPGR